MDIETCAICLEEIKIDENNLMRLPTCHHTFHNTCFLLYIEANAYKSKVNCPICREHIIEIKHPVQVPNVLVIEQTVPANRNETKMIGNVILITCFVGFIFLTFSLST